MESPARKPNQHERQRALRLQARAGDPVAQAQVDAINAANRASAAKAKAAGRDYASPEKRAVHRAKKQAATVLTPEQAQRAHERQQRLALAKQAREAVAALELSAEAKVAQVRAWEQASNRAGYLAFKARVAAGDPDAVAKYEQRLANNRQACRQCPAGRAGTGS